LFLLWLSVTLLNVPCVLVWAHNYRWEEWALFSILAIVNCAFWVLPNFGESSQSPSDRFWNNMKLWPETVDA
jgi:membrane protein implicated in regulation of membrane protease activity